MIGVYVFVDADERPLYVGVSKDVARRVNQWRSQRPAWWPRVVDLWTYPADTRTEAARREKHLIHKLCPPGNMYGFGRIGCPCGCGAA